VKVNFNTDSKKLQILYVLWAIENFSDENHRLKQDDIVKILQDNGYKTDRRTVADSLQLLKSFGYNIHGLSENNNGKSVASTRGAIYLERELSDNKLQLLMDSVLFSKHLSKEDGKTLSAYVASKGSLNFKESQAKNCEVFSGTYSSFDDNLTKNELETVRLAINASVRKRISFKYGQRVQKGEKYTNSGEVFTVSPYYLVVHNGMYYLFAYDHAGNIIRHFKLNKMNGVKITKEDAKPQSETELKDYTVNEYISAHPYLFAGEPEHIILKVQSSALSYVKDTFGESVELIKQGEKFSQVKVFCNQRDAYYWAMQFSDVAQVLEPQSLREELYHRARIMARKYSRFNADRYNEAIAVAKHTGRLWIRDTDISNQKEHHSLSQVRVAYFMRAELENADFLKNYKNLRALKLDNNPIEDLTPLGELDGLIDLVIKDLPNVKNLDFLYKLKNLTSLGLDVDRDVDCSAVNSLDKLKQLIVSERTTYNTTIDWKKLENQIANNRMRIRSDTISPNETKNEDSKNFPFNVFEKILGITSYERDADGVKSALEKALSSVGIEERDVFYAWYKMGFCEKHICHVYGMTPARISGILSEVNDVLRSDEKRALFAPFIKS